MKFLYIWTINKSFQIHVGHRCAGECAAVVDATVRGILCRWHQWHFLNACGDFFTDWYV